MSVESPIHVPDLGEYTELDDYAVLEFMRNVFHGSGIVELPGDARDIDNFFQYGRMDYEQKYLHGSKFCYPDAGRAVVEFSYRFSRLSRNQFEYSQAETKRRSSIGATLTEAGKEVYEIKVFTPHHMLQTPSILFGSVYAHRFGSSGLNVPRNLQLGGEIPDALSEREFEQSDMQISYVDNEERLNASAVKQLSVFLVSLNNQLED